MYVLFQTCWQMLPGVAENRYVYSYSKVLAHVYVSKALYMSKSKPVHKLTKIKLFCSGRSVHLRAAQRWKKIMFARMTCNMFEQNPAVRRGLWSRLEQNCCFFVWVFGNMDRKFGAWSWRMLGIIWKRKLLQMSNERSASELGANALEQKAVCLQFAWRKHVRLPCASNLAKKAAVSHAWWSGLLLVLLLPRNASARRTKDCPEGRPPQLTRANLAACLQLAQI